MTELIQYPQALTIAGSDSGGGAGMQPDLKTIESRHVFATTVIVAITAQNTLGVQDLLAIPTAMIDAQFASLAADFDIKACKTGALADVTTVRAVVKNLKRYAFGPLTVDPVMVAKGGAALLSEAAIKVVKSDLLPLATLVTPNLPEAEKLSGRQITTMADMKKAAIYCQTLGAKNVIIKGGHLSDQDCAADFVLLESGKTFWLKSARIDTIRTHGTGDTLSACITAELAKGASMESAIRTGKDYVQAAIREGIIVGHGHGPLNHWVDLKAPDQTISEAKS